jgi:hypothetical protein
MFCLSDDSGAVRGERVEPADICWLNVCVFDVASGFFTQRGGDAAPARFPRPDYSWILCPSADQRNDRNE